MNPAAIVLPNWVGDVAMATPALRALRAHWCDRPLVGVVRPYVRDVLSGSSWLDEIIPCDRRSPNPAERFRSVVRQLRARRVDTVVLFPNSLRSGLLAWLSGAPTRIGYARYGRRPLLTHALRPPRHHGRLVPVSAVGYYLGLAEAAGCCGATQQLELHTTDAEETASAAIWRELDLGDQVIGLNTGGAYGPAKSWPPEYAAELAQRIARELDRQVLILCGPHEAAAARQIEHRAHHAGVRSLADHPTGIGQLKAVIRRLQMLVTTDSGPRHLAAGLRVPTITLMGPIDPRWSEYHRANSEVLTADLECRPCGGRSCAPGHHRCMRDLTADRVFSAVRRHVSPPLLPTLVGR